MSTSPPLGPEKIRVNLGDRSYEIRFGSGNLASMTRQVADQRGITHAVLITDDHVETLHAVTVAEALSDAGVAVYLIFVDAG